MIYIEHLRYPTVLGGGGNTRWQSTLVVVASRSLNSEINYVLPRGCHRAQSVAQLSVSAVCPLMHVLELHLIGLLTSSNRGTISRDTVNVLKENNKIERGRETLEAI